jgi:acetylglutamate kinase
MRPKLEAGLAALAAGVPRVHLVDGRLPHALLLEILTDRGVGTLLVQDGDEVLEERAGDRAADRGEAES